MDLMMKFVALGDSIIKGVLYNKEESGHTHYSLADHNLVDLVAQKLHNEVLNLAKIGCTIEAGERILNHHLSHLDGAKYVLMCYGGNDSDYNWKDIANQPEAEHLPHTPLHVFEKTYTRIVKKVQELGYTPLIMSLPPMNAQQYFDFFTSSFDQHQKSNVLKWLKGEINTIWAGHELYNDAVKRVASATDCVLIDCSTTLGDGQGYLCEDGIHPNLAGQAKIASIIIKNI